MEPQAREERIDAAIEVRALTFDYPALRALDGIDFSLPRGGVTALVGPNGAGKTTLLRCLAALHAPFAGSVRVLGIDAIAEPRACHRRIGHLPDFFGLYDELTAGRCLEYAALSRGVPPELCAERVAVAAARLGIAGLLGARAGRLSRGQRQALAIAQAIIHEPEVLLLDEPASGLDPEARRGLARLLLALRDAGMTILVSSHILSELEEYATDILVLRGGRLVEQRSLGGGEGGAVVIGVALAGPAAGLEALLAAFPGVSGVVVEPRCARFRFAGDAAARHRLLRALIEAGLPVASFAVEREGLRHAYFAGIGAEGDAEGREP